jgi:hypothetical protein
VRERKGGKKNRKLGRNRARCQAYRLAGTREANKVRRIVGDARRARDPLAVPIPEAYRSSVGAALRANPSGPRAARRRLRVAAHGEGPRSGTAPKSARADSGRT